MPKPNEKPDKQRKIKDWLTNHGHDKAKVDKLKLDDDETTKKELLELHGMTEQEYRERR